MNGSSPSQSKILAIAYAGGLELNRRGNNYIALCCFHLERTASLQLAPEIDAYHCFGCGARGGYVKLAECLGVDLAHVLGPLVPETVHFHQSSVARANHSDCLQERETANQERWAELSARHPDGEAYLASRGLGGIAHPDTIRFDVRGEVCVPLRAFDDGRIINVARRRIDSVAEHKVLLYKGAGTGKGCFGDVRHLGETFGAIVVTEGMTDYLTALGHCEDELVLGARCASLITLLVETLVDWVQHRGLVIVMHPDEVGRIATQKTIERARHLGVPSDKIRIHQPVGGDLNDAHRRAS